MTAARSRALASGSGKPIFAATVISRLSFEKRAERFLSCAPFRYMMFLNLLWPAMIENPAKWYFAGAPIGTPGRLIAASGQTERLAIGFEEGILLLSGVRLHLPQPHDHAHDLGVVAVGLRLGIDVADIVRDALLLLLEPLD